MSDKLIESGSITFASRVKPALPVGDYKLSIESDLTVTEKPALPSGISLPGQDTKRPVRTAELALTVDCERTILPPDGLYSIYPPAGFSGKYGKCLPHIILQRCTFPWERKLKNDISLPWTALLVFSEGDGELFSTLEMNENDSRAPVPPPRTFVPDVYNKLYTEIEPENKQISVVDIPGELFCRILPYAQELNLLTHVRSVSLDDKVTDSSVTDGMFSCVVANRLPLIPNGSEPVAHRACLVSLEGFEDFLPGDASRRESLLNQHGCERVRMFSLYSWDFYCARAEMDFDVYAAKLKASVMRGNTEDLHDAELKRAVERGYCPVNHIMRDGSFSVSWYRTPLLPQKPERDYIPFGSFADALLRYDKELDMLDVTYSAAWQLGRLLAMQNQPFTSELVHWRMENKGKAAREHNRRFLMQICDEAHPAQAASNANDASAPDGEETVVWTEFLTGLDDSCGISDPLGIRGTDLEELVDMIDFTNLSETMHSIYRKKPPRKGSKRISEKGKPEELIPMLHSMEKRRRNRR